MFPIRPCLYLLKLYLKIYLIYNRMNICSSFFSSSNGLLHFNLHFSFSFFNVMYECTFTDCIRRRENCKYITFSRNKNFLLLLSCQVKRVFSLFFSLTFFELLISSKLPRQNCAVQRLANCHVDSLFFAKVKPSCLRVQNSLMICILSYNFFC